MTLQPVAQKMEKGDCAVKAIAVSKKYSQENSKALDDFNLCLTKGEFYGLLGPNGAGKSTALAILSTRISPDDGKVFMHGKDLQKYTREVKKLFGLVPQDIALYEQLTVRENLLFFGRLYGLRGLHLTRQIEYCLDFARLEKYTKQKVAACSGGMKRRLNLAIGLLHNPPILLLDEPTVGIDAQSRNHLHRQLLTLNKKGTTILYTTHYMEEAQELCSRIGIIDQGTIIQEGPPEDLLQHHDCKHLEDLFLKLTGRQLRDN